MIPLTEYKAYFEGMMRTDIRIKRVLLVINESHLAKVIKDIDDDELFMIAVIPSADVNAMNADNRGDMNAGLIYIVNKVDRKSYDDSEMLQVLGRTQSVMNNVKQKMVDDCQSNTVTEMTQLDLPSMHMDPEYDFLGCDGWSLSFNFKTNGF